MKKLLIACMLIASATVAYAQPYRYNNVWNPQVHHYRHGYNHHWRDAAGVIAGAIILNEVIRPREVYVQPMPTYVQPMTTYVQPTYVQPQIVTTPVCSEWTTVQNADGSFTQTRTCRQ